MTGDPKETPSVNTSGGAYVAGNVSTQGGDFVGRDKRVTAGERGIAVGGSVKGATLEDLKSLLAELKGLLPQTGLPADVAEVIEGDFKVVEQQVDKAAPNGSILKNKLKGMLDLLTSSGNAAGSLEKILSVAGKAAQVAGLLFP